MEIKTPTLTPRLRAAADLVRHGAFVADVGTDHAYLPIALVTEGRAVGAVASDINEGPYTRALANIHAHSLEKKIAAVHCAGLEGIEKFSPTDILICGMGGELIASIIEDAPWTKDPSIRLVLQPMTHPEMLRGYLLDHGYEIIEERIVREEKLYQIICAEYEYDHDGKTHRTSYSDTELLLGKQNIERGGELLAALIEHHIAVTERIRKSKLSAGADTSEENALIKTLKEIKNDHL